MSLPVVALDYDRFSLSDDDCWAIDDGLSLWIAAKIPGTEDIGPRFMKVHDYVYGRYNRSHKAITDAFYSYEINLPEAQARFLEHDRRYADFTRRESLIEGTSFPNMLERIQWCKQMQESRKHRKITEMAREQERKVVPIRPDLPVPPKVQQDTPPAPKKPTNVIQSSAEFLKGFVPPDYLIDGILQRRFCYALTARGGVGKTAIAMRLAAHVATGAKLGALEVEKGTVLYFAFENPTDIQMRWLGLTMQMGIDPNTADIHFVTVGRMTELAGALEVEMQRKGIKPVLVVVDTVAASFEGDNENDNTQMVEHARRLRSLTMIEGGPCVLMLAHPTKNAPEPEGLVPRGGSGFLNEIDGNIGLMRNDKLLGMQVVAKFRGVQFNPIHFELLTVNHPRLVDSKNRSIPTVVAKPVDEASAADREAEAGRDEDALLREIDRRPGLSRRDVAKLLGWHDSKVGRVAKKLEGTKLIVAERKGGWKLTERGQKELSALENAMIAKLPPPQV